MRPLHLLTCLILLLASMAVTAQAPNQMNYQAVARNAAGIPLTNQAVKLRLSIIQGTHDGPIQYSETRDITTNSLGLFSVGIGSTGASDVTGSISQVPWQSGDKFLKVEIDPAGGNAFTDMGSSQLLSVPFALHSADNQWKTNGNHIGNKNSGNVGIGTQSPDQSALLDINSDSKGLLMPRMTAAQRTSISQPATGLLVYQTEAPQGFYYNEGTPASSDWVYLNGTGPQGPQGQAGPSGIIKSYSLAGTAPYPSSTMNFITKPIEITVQDGESVFMIATRALGARDLPASDLGIIPASQNINPGSPIDTLSIGMYGLEVPPHTRVTYAVNGVFKNLPAGTYRFGMAGITTNTGWINSEWGYTTAIVFKSN